MKKIAAITILLFLSLVPLSFAGTASFSLDNNGIFNDLPEPRLRYPINDTVILTANEPLEFKWWDDLVGIRGFTLKIYKGYNMYAGDLIFKEELPADASSFKVKSDFFQDGQVYTWSLIRVSYTGSKSDKSFNSFKVIKKQGSNP
ncbi:MAG: hypothetical protein PHC71_02645 [Candidatus Omnitrophica bacterium]|nr:hypothetical protein [Candidatus Omnitrophota bacterium]